MLVAPPAFIGAGRADRGLCGGLRALRRRALLALAACAASGERRPAGALSACRPAPSAPAVYGTHGDRSSSVLVVIAMLATLGVMFAGMLGLVAARTRMPAARSNRLMRWRVSCRR